MISPAGCCDYRVLLGRSASGVLCGRADRDKHTNRHPGICGDRPRITLADDTVMLQSTRSTRIVQTLRSYGGVNWGPPASAVRLQIGGAFEAIAREGDQLDVARGGTAEIALALFRGDELQMAAGALQELDMGGAVVVEEDPRLKDQDVYGVAAWLAEPGRELVWVNADDGAERAAAKVSTARGRDLVIAIAGRDPVARRELNHRLALPLTADRRSRWFIDVDARFLQREQWLDYVLSLPRTLPPDVWLKVRIGDTVTRLHEGEYALVPPWHLHLVHVRRTGLPGTLSQLAVAREHPALSREIVVHSANLIGSGGDIQIRK